MSNEQIIVTLVVFSFVIVSIAMDWLDMARRQPACFRGHDVRGNIGWQCHSHWRLRQCRDGRHLFGQRRLSDFLPLFALWLAHCGCATYVCGPVRAGHDFDSLTRIKRVHSCFTNDR